MTKQPGQIYAKPQAERAAEIIKVTAKRIKFAQYHRGTPLGVWTWSEREFDKWFPVYVSN